MQNYPGSSGLLVLRAEVYAWNGSEATGNALYESAPKTISFKDSAFHKETFAPGVSVTPDTEYVLFLSTDKDYSECSGQYFLDWGAVAARKTQREGDFVYQNNAGDYANWTKNAWNHYGYDDLYPDLAFSAYISQ